MKYFIYLLIICQLALSGCYKEKVDTSPNNNSSSPINSQISNESNENQMSQTELRLKLETKPEYSEEEKIIATVALKNQSSHPLLFNKRFIVYAPNVGDVSFLIKDEKNNVYSTKYKLDMAPVRAEDFIILKPGENFTKEINIKEIYGLEKDHTYSIQAKYQNRYYYQKDGISSWQGTVTSDLQIFKVGKGGPTLPSISKEGAIISAELFILDNGYSDEPFMLYTDRKISLEMTDSASETTEQVLKKRFGTLEEKAISAQSSNKEWRIYFKIKGKEKIGRVVTMTLDGQNIKLEHQEVNLETLEPLAYQ